MVNRRIKVHFDDRFKKIESQHRRCWMQISSTMKTVSDLQYEICSRCIDSSEIDGVYLSLENFTLLPSEDIAVVQNGDKIDVRRKLNKSKGAKKRLKIKNSEETTTVSLKETTIKLGSKIAVPSESASLASKSTSASQITTSVALSSSSSSSSGESSSSEDTSSSEEDNSQNTSASICHTITKSHKICASPSVLQPVTVVSTPSNSKHKRFTTESDATSVLSTKVCPLLSSSSIVAYSFLLSVGDVWTPLNTRDRHPTPSSTLSIHRSSKPLVLFQ